MAELDRNKIELIEMYRDNPAAAARDLLGIDLAPHQRVILKSMWDCDNVIAVLSRGSGKCVTGDTIVMTNNGFDYIDNLCRRSGEQFGFARARCYKVFGENGFHRPKFRYINEPKKVIKIKTKFGYSITGVPKHNIRCLCGNEVKWKELGRIKIGDKAIISKDTDYVFYDNYHCRMVDFKHGYRLGYSVKYNKEGRLHYYILRCCNEGLRGFICGLFDRYSYCDKGETTLFFKTKELARFVHIGLLIYGIVSKLEEDQITIYPDYFYQFVEQISSKIENKLAYYNIVMEHLEKVEHPKYFADEIVGIEVIDNVITYDFSFDKDYTFISNGFISHNTFIDGVFSTLRALLYPGERVGLFSGSFRQAKFIFDEVSKIYDISSILRESCEKKPTKMVDQCYLQFKGYNNKPGSIIQCLPLGNGDKIRGARFFTVICDEAAQIPADILDIVIRGMMATSKNPMEQVRALQEQKRLLAEGKIDKIKKLHQNKLVLTSTAYYQYNHLWKRVELFVRLLMEKVEKAKQFSERGLDIPEELKVELRGHDINNQIPYNVMKDNQRSLITCTYEDMPEGFMNMDSIEEAKIQMPRYQFLMEYCSLFPADSDGFFPMSVLDKARSHGEFACCESLKKEDGWINIMACDPARSGDNFAIAIVRANKETKKIRLVRVFTYNKKPFPFMHLEIRKLLNQFSINELVIDSGGGGRTIRDLLADKGACPPGEDIILQIDFEEHRYLKGKKILRLVEFSDYEWLSNANNNMLLGLQNGTFQIASEKGKLKNISGDYDENSIEEEMRREIDRTIEEIQNIVVTRTNVGRMHWDTPHRNQRKDRYSAVLMGYDAAYYYIDNLTKPQKLISGFWM